MNIGRAYSWSLAVWLLICIPSAIASVQLADSTFQDWSGEMSDAVMSDGSVLYQYTSRTFSGSVDGAMLALSFIPRFHCAPTFNLRVRGSEQTAVSEPVLELSFGDDALKFPGFVDSKEGFLTYSVMASSEQMEELRQLLDESPRVRVSIDSGSDTGPAVESVDDVRVEVDDGILFSLLGSRRAALSAQAHCQTHEPVAFQPR